MYFSFFPLPDSYLLMLFLPLTTSPFHRQHSWMCSACSICVTATHASIAGRQCDRETHTHTHAQPKLSWLLLRQFCQSSCLAWGSALTNTHFIHVGYFLSCQAAEIWCGLKGLTGAVWRCTSDWVNPDRLTGRGSSACSERDLVWWFKEITCHLLVPDLLTFTVSLAATTTELTVRMFSIFIATCGKDVLKNLQRSSFITW